MEKEQSVEQTYMRFYVYLQTTEETDLTDMNEKVYEVLDGQGADSDGAGTCLLTGTRDYSGYVVDENVAGLKRDFVEMFGDVFIRLNILHGDLDSDDWYSEDV